jgi:exodeoxyribonuclease VII small subunit
MATAKVPTFGFSKKLEELEAITASLEQDGADLDKGLAQFDRGMKLVSELREYLNEAAGRVEEIKQKYDLPTADAPDLPDEVVDTLPF